ncbi:MAG: hypothetical protein V1904_06415 [Bacteroidota bacterium]
MKIFSIHIYIIFVAFALGCGSQKNNKIESSDKTLDTVITHQSNNDTTVLNETTENKTAHSLNNSTLYTGTDFTVIYATSQQWHGGVKGSGGGVNYEVSMVTKLSSLLLTIDELWIGEIFHETKASRKFPETSADGYSAGDTIFLYASDYKKNPEGPEHINEINEQKEVQDTKQNTPPPYKYTGEALIGYKINGERKYKEIAKITVKSLLFYP